MKLRKKIDEKKLSAAFGILLFLIAGGAFAWFFGIPIFRFASDREAFRAWMNAHGITGRIAYMGMVIAQIVVAIIPGEPLEIAAGYAFGAWEGTVLCLLSEFIGSMIVFLLVRKFGIRLVKVFFSEEKLRSVRFLRSGPKKELLFLIVFMIPGTPKDLLCYFAGLTDIRWFAWLLICSLGRIPSVITSTLGGSALGDRNYLLAGIVFALTLIISAGGLLLYQFICKKHAGKDPEDP